MVDRPPSPGTLVPIPNPFCMVSTWLLLVTVMLVIPFVLTALPAWLTSDPRLKRIRLKTMLSLACLAYLITVSGTVYAFRWGSENFWEILFLAGFVWAFPLASSTCAVLACWGTGPLAEPEGIGFTPQSQTSAPPL